MLLIFFSGVSMSFEIGNPVEDPKCPGFYKTPPELDVVINRDGDDWPTLSDADKVETNWHALKVISGINPPSNIEGGHAHYFLF